jgi:hypothetical protein
MQSVAIKSTTRTIGCANISRKKEEKMRDCETCILARPFGGEEDNRCSAWDCDYINRTEAIEIWKAYKKGELVWKESKGE